MKESHIDDAGLSDVNLNVDDLEAGGGRCLMTTLRNM